MTSEETLVGVSMFLSEGYDSAMSAVNGLIQGMHLARRDPDLANSMLTGLRDVVTDDPMNSLADAFRAMEASAVLIIKASAVARMYDHADRCAAHGFLLGMAFGMRHPELIDHVLGQLPPSYVIDELPGAIRRVYEAA